MAIINIDKAINRTFNLFFRRLELEIRLAKDAANKNSDDIAGTEGNKKTPIIKSLNPAFEKLFFIFSNITPQIIKINLQKSFIFKDFIFIN